MSLRDLVTFAQNEICHRELHDTRDRLPLSSLNWEGAARLPSTKDSNLLAERPPIPDWMTNPENEIIQIGGPTSAIFSESDFDEPIT